MTPIETSTPPRCVELASLALAGALANALPIETSLTLAEALAVLSDVTPPYPPLPAQVPALPLSEALPLAAANLTAAIELSEEAEERLRCGRVLRLLRDLDEPS